MIKTEENDFVSRFTEQVVKREKDGVSRFVSSLVIVLFFIVLSGLFAVLYFFFNSLPIALVICVLIVLLTLPLILRRTKTEFEYCAFADEIRFAKITGNAYRHEICTVNIRNIEYIGKSGDLPYLQSEISFSYNCSKNRKIDGECDFLAWREDDKKGVIYLNIGNDLKRFLQSQKRSAFIS